MISSGYPQMRGRALAREAKQQQNAREAMREPGWHGRNDGTEARHHPARAEEVVEGTEERADILGGHALHLFRDTDAGDYVCWLNTEVSDFDGLVLGMGKTRDEAVADAVKVLEAALERLQSSPKL